MAFGHEWRGGISNISFAEVPENSVKDQQMLAVLRKDGVVEFFARPFSDSPKRNTNGEISSQRVSKTRKANATLQLVLPNSKISPAVVNASLHGPDLVVAIAEGGVDVSFQKVRWQDEGSGELLFEGNKLVPYTRSASSLNAVTTNGVKDVSKAQIDESRAVVMDAGAEGSSQEAAIAIMSSDVELDDEGEEDDEEDEEEEESGVLVVANEEESSDPDAEMEDHDQDQLQDNNAAQDAADEDEDMQPSFGELIAAQNNAVISVGNSLPTEEGALLPTGSKTMSFSSAMSLSTVLSQSLRTNDNSMLESCLHNQSTEIIQATIQRLDSSLAGLLIQKLAERISSRPGRYAHLTTWVQWICVVHGGALASQPSSVEKMRTLHKVLAQRSRCLEDLLLLKGKLDMLDAQLQFRKQLRQQREQIRPMDDSNVIMVEGEDNWSSTDDDDVGEIAGPSRKSKGKAPRKNLDDISDIGSSEDEYEEESDIDEATTSKLPNGISHIHSDVDDSDEDDDDEEDLNQQSSGMIHDVIEDEAEESASNIDQDERDSDDAEDSDEDEEEDDASEADSFINDGVDNDEIEDDVDNGYIGLAQDTVAAAEEDDDEEPERTPERRPSKKARRT